MSERIHDQGTEGSHHENKGLYDHTPYTHQMHHEDIVETIQECEAVCEHMVTLLLRKQNWEMRRVQIQLLRDCADICTLTVKYIARSSAFARHLANLCAGICEKCGRECLRHHDPESQNCGHICLNCARECREFAMMP